MAASGNFPGAIISSSGHQPGVAGVACRHVSSLSTGCDRHECLAWDDELRTTCRPAAGVLEMPASLTKLHIRNALLALRHSAWGAKIESHWDKPSRRAISPRSQFICCGCTPSEQIAPRRDAYQPTPRWEDGAIAGNEADRRPLCRDHHTHRHHPTVSEQGQALRGMCYTKRHLLACRSPD